MTRHGWPWALWVIPLVIGSTQEARAQEDPAIEISGQTRVLAGQGRPTVVLTALRPLQDVTVRVTLADGTGKAMRLGNLGMGASREVPLPATPGHWTARLEVRSRALKEPEVFEIPVVVARPLQIALSKDTVDLEEGRIVFTPSEAIARVSITVRGEEGKVLHQAEEDRPSEPGVPVTVTFPAGLPAITSISLRVHDPDGFYNGVEIQPFFIEVPHEEVTFEFGKADIRPEEAPKLERTLQRVHEALAKFGSELKARLYIGGYTDTVGSRESNQDLSDRRARAIASWFLAHGLHVRACYQGFGEDALAVPTPDETPEARNRRTIHVLAPQAPPVSRVFPRDRWTCL
ncbi:MAG TPA: OmpA family protein [Myxococcota bacterium]|nr:OmpA family protein [Myxococcota bacterium]HQK50977.1 OmpA family protein [Myxococcota bacterium]